MQKFIFLPAAILLASLVAGCSSGVTYNSDFREGVDFGKLKTFRWHDTNQYNDSSKDYLANDITDSRIREEVNTLLQQKGFSYSESGEVDFLVNYSITTEERMDVRTYNNYAGYAPGWGFDGYYHDGFYSSGVGYGMAVSTDTRTTYYTQGTFILDVILPAEDQLAWRGSAEGRLSKKSTAEQNAAAVKEVVAGVLGEFPPHPH